MIYSLYSIFDSVAGAYMQPYLAVNDNVAIRNFAANFAKEGDIMSLNAADFRLVKVGSFDPTNGVIEPCEPILVIDGVSARNSIER